MKAAWILALLTWVSPAWAEPGVLPLIPWPTRLSRAQGSFLLTTTTPVRGPLCHELAKYLHLSPGRRGAPISLHLAPKLKGRTGEEGYLLDITPKAIDLRAATPAGLFYAIQTLRQLLPTGHFQGPLPVLSIEDRPRFSWRGAHLDVSRHFMPPAFIRRFLDLMAIHKLNRFHWHLTDDQGWRLEIRRYPRLTEVGAWRKGTLIGHHQDASERKIDNRRYGGFYTQAEVRDIVAYAAARHIVIIPEIEMPGHSQAAVAAYPELGCTHEAVETRTVWGVSPYLLNADDSTLRFMKNVLDEVMELFPSPWIHVGGDEAIKAQWKASPQVQARIHELGLRDEDHLQSWFIGQMDTYLHSKGRHLVGWDEILEGGLAPHATVMAWRDAEHGYSAARAGHDAILTPTTYTYFDFYQSPNVLKEPLAIGGLTPLEKVYSWEPVPAGTAAQNHILGVQGQLWTEYIPDPQRVEYMAFPRLCALAEVAWSRPPRADFARFRDRLETHLDRLKLMGVHFRPLDP